jgi:hypothetical protein
MAALKHASAERHRYCAERFRGVTHDIAEIKEWVARSVVMRNRASRVVLVVMSVAGVVWAIAKTLYY